jgi:hypothetical protein
MSKKLARPRLILISCLMSATVAFGSGPSGASLTEANEFETRCGWFSNPTPGNASLYDRDREWIIGVQGGYQAEGDWPDFATKQWVETNVHYGYGCACLRLRVNPKTHEVIEIESARARPLATCRRDRSLKRWGFK